MKTAKIQRLQRLLTLLVATVLAVLTASAAVDPVQIRGVCYKLSSTGNTASVCGSTAEDVVIKSSITVDGKSYKVNEIGLNEYLEFIYAPQIKSVSIPSSVTTIDPSFFKKCSSLVSISSESAKYVVKDNVLYNNDYTQIIVVCKDVQSITIPETVTAVNAGLYNCTNLTEIRLPNSIELSYNSFYGCSSLTEFIVDESNHHFSVNNGMLFSKDLTRLIAVPAGLDNVTIPSSVSVIGRYAFWTCTKIKNVIIPESVLTIQQYAFSESGLTEIDIPNTVQTLDGWAFHECPKLKTAVVSDNVKEIGWCAFDKCRVLQTVYIGKNVTSIGFGAFNEDTSLSAIYSANPIPPAAHSTAFGTEGSPLLVPRTATVYVPMESVEAYKNTNVWKQFNIVGYDFDKVMATEIGLDKTSLTLTEGQTDRLTATVTPDDASDKRVMWTTSDESVATVDQDGNVTAVSQGTATITATTTDGSDLSAECIVTVTLKTEVDEITTGGNTFAQVFTADGVLVFSGKLSDWTRAGKGIYIVRTASRTEKISVR